jgi:hypothetical protein
MSLRVAAVTMMRYQRKLYGHWHWPPGTVPGRAWAHWHFKFKLNFKFNFNLKPLAA